MIFGDVNAAQTLVPNVLKFGERVQDFLTMLHVLCPNSDFVSPASIERFIIEGLDYFVSVHLGFWGILFFVPYS